MGSKAKTFSELLAELQASADEVASLSKDSETEPEILAEFSVLVAKFGPILDDLRESRVLDTPPIRKAVESLEKELGRARGLMKSSSPKISVKLIGELTRGLGRSLGLILFASLDFLSVDIKEKMGALHKEMMKAKFDASSSPDPEEPEFDPEIEFVNEFGVEDETVEEIQEVEEEIIDLDVDDVVLQLKYGKDDEFKLALAGLRSLIKDKVVDDEWINDEGIVLILWNRLGSSQHNNRLTIIQVLRSLVMENAKNKVYARSLAMILVSLILLVSHFQVMCRRSWLTRMHCRPL